MADTETAPLLAVHVQDVSFRYGDLRSPLALSGVRLTVRAGEFLALAGANGSGKTTLAKHLNGLLRPVSGRVLLDGVDLATRSLGQIARTVGYLFQNPDHQIFLPTVAQEVAFGPSNLGVAGQPLAERVAEVLERFGLSGVAERHPTLLGRGMRRRVALAAVFAMQPRLLVLDEPTGGLDRRATGELLDQLDRLVASGGAVVLITHDMRLVGERVPRLVVLRDGQVVADGPTADIMADAPLLVTSGLRQAPVARLAADLATAGMPPALNVEQFCAGFLRTIDVSTGRIAPGPAE